jgi:zinc protease
MTLRPARLPASRSRRRLLIAGGATALAAVPAVAAVAADATVVAAAPAPAASARHTAVTLPPLQLSERHLPNGLHVVGLPVPGGGTVAVQMWYRVGSKDDPPGRSGFAHLFEHMMFKATRHMPDEMFDRLTEDVGGVNNAFTAADVTVYQSEVPGNHLERLLWAEAERLAHLNVDQAAFDSERAVVKEEYRERVEASPYGRLFNALPPLAYQRHPYKRPGIGNIAELDAATLADVRDFHATYYRPDNATLIVAGDFDPAQLDAWVDRHFGRLPKPEGRVPRVSITEPLRTQPRRSVLQAPVVPLPALAMLWQGPRADDADAPALEVAAALLAGGESSRLQQALVYRARSAQSAGFYADLNADAGMLAAYAIGASGATLADLESALRQQIAALAQRPIARDELDKVRTQLLTAKLVERQTPEGLATALGWALAMHGDVRAAERELPRLQAVSAADVQRVLQRHVLQRPAVVVEYTQGRPS